MDFQNPNLFPLTSIIILTFNNLAKTERCLHSIRTYTNMPYELILVDNGSTDGTVEYLKGLTDAQIILNKKNKGFAAGCNLGIRIANGSQILLLNNDTVVSHSWLENLLKALYSHPEVGIVGPRSNYVIQGQMLYTTYKNDEEYHHFAKSFNKHEPAKWRELAAISGFCMLLKKTLIQKIGNLDERYIVGNAEDIDFCYRALQYGYRLLVAGDTIVHHDGNSSFTNNKLDIVSISRGNRKQFIRKWGINPEKLKYGYFNQIIDMLRKSYQEKTMYLIKQKSIYPNGILLKGSAPHVYFLEEDKKRHVVNEETLRFFNFKWECVIHVPDSDLACIPTGQPIDHTKPVEQYAPKNLIIQDHNGSVYRLSYGIKYPFAHADVFRNLKYNDNDIVHIPELLIHSFYNGPSLTGEVFDEHELIPGRLFVRTNGERYYCDDHKLRKIHSDREFYYFKWHKENLIPITEAEFNTFPIGEPIQL